MTPDAEGPQVVGPLPGEYVPQHLPDEMYASTELVSVGYGWLPVWLDVIKTAALIVIAVALVAMV